MRKKIKTWQGGLGLIITGTIILLLFLPDNSPEVLSSRIITSIDSEISAVNTEFADLLSDLENGTHNMWNSAEMESGYWFYIFEGKSLSLWSTNRLVPELADLSAEPLQLYKDSGWQGLVRQWELDSSSTTLIVFIPLIYDPPISNQYLGPTWNENILDHWDVQINDKPGLEYNYKIGDQLILSFSLGDSYVRTRAAHQYSGFMLTAAGFLLLFISFFSSSAPANPKQGIIGLLSLLLLWTSTYVLFKFLDNERLLDALSIFDSLVYASSRFLNNLADLLLFCLLILSLSIFFLKWSSSWGYKQFILSAGPKASWLIATLTIIVLYYVLTLHFLIFRDLYDNSAISLNLYHSSDVSISRFIALLIFAINAVSVFLLFNLFFRTWVGLTRSKLRFQVISFALGTGIFLLVENDFPVAFLIPTMAIYLIILRWTKVHRFFPRIHYLSLMYVVSSLIISCVIGALSIRHLEAFQTSYTLYNYSRQNFLENDLFGEHLMAEAVNNVKTDQFIPNWLTTPFVSKDIIGRKIRQIYLGRYLERYDVIIDVYDSRGVRYSNPNVENFQSIVSTYAVETNQTDFPDIYLINRSRAIFKRYLAIATIERDSVVLGHVTMQFVQKEATPTNVYPELLLHSRLIQPYQLDNVSYAVYNDQGRLMYSNGDFNYYTDFDSVLLAPDPSRVVGRSYKGYTHLVFYTWDNRTLVVSTTGHSAKEVLSNFSFLFLVLMLISGISLFIFYYPRRRDETLWGYAAKIQFYINVAFILPLFLVSITTLSLITNSSLDRIQTEYVKRASELASQIHPYLSDFLKSPGKREALVEELRRMARLLAFDANVYSLEGRLIATTQPDIYSEGLISRFVHPRSFDHMMRKASNDFTMSDNVGQLEYKTTYVQIKTQDTSRRLGVLSLPFFDHQETLKSQQIEVLVNILNIFSVLFLILLVISYFASKRLVIPLILITRKLNKTSFTGYNEPIEWHSKDELGRLVGEYNQMIRNLAKSREALARSQRELAWREIARHVAHEIKNPLTPMKLTLQQLQRRIAGKGKINIEEVKLPVHSLLDQVETLKDIASSFSAFAKMPIPDVQKLNISEVLRQSFDLHKNENDLSIEFKGDAGDKDVHVLGDKKLMGRIFTNIILNAKQSTSNHLNIWGEIHKSNRNVVISIRDNGPGIPEEIRNKVFLPGFSTKNKGSGIGLAIAKHGIEQSGGQIWFETSQSDENSGTTFFIELPGAEA